MRSTTASSRRTSFTRGCSSHTTAACCSATPSHRPPVIARAAALSRAMMRSSCCVPPGYWTPHTTCCPQTVAAASRYAVVSQIEYRPKKVLHFYTDIDFMMKVLDCKLERVYCEFAAAFVELRVLISRFSRKYESRSCMQRTASVDCRRQKLSSIYRTNVGTSAKNSCLC